MPRDSAVARAVRLLIVPLAALALLPVLLTELHVFSLHDLVGSAIPDTIYLEHAAQGLVRGHIPYGADFLTKPDRQLVFVYPPLTLLLAIPPLLAGSHYSFGFAVELLLFLAVCLWLLQRACLRMGIAFPVALAAGLLLIAMGPVVVTRLDGLQGLALAGAALALRSRRMALAVALVTLAVLVKETVAVAALPIVVWAIWPRDGQTWRQGLGRRLGAVGWGLVPAAVLILVFAVWSRGNVFSAASTSLHRGVEIESIPATISYLLSPIFKLTSYGGSLGSQQVSGSQVGLVAALVGVIGVVALIWGSIHFAREGRRPATAVAFAIAIGLATTPVLSPQYLLALVTVLALAAGSETGRARGRLLLAACLAMALLTQAEFPYLFGSVAKLDPVGTAIVALRNLLLIAIAVGLARTATASSSTAVVGGEVHQPVASGLA
ncbi:MAG: hypothetical protein WA938_04260 [Candidatus Dormiibacterota bacterium]